MTTPLTAMHTDDDNDDKKRPHKKGRVVQPLDEESIKKQLSAHKDAQKVNGDVLAELAAKTAELTANLNGPEGPKERVLTLDETDNANVKDIFAALEETQSEPAKESSEKSADASPAVELIRAKLDKLYGSEPDAVKEAAEAIAKTKHRSKHQQFMYDLTTSGKSLADIQTAWHEYYVGLPNDEKHAVWQEFYHEQRAMSHYGRQRHEKAHVNLEIKQDQLQPNKQVSTTPLSASNNHSPATIKSQILHKISAGGQLKPIHHLKSALFGIGLASVVGLAITFVFFNEVFVAPLVSPSKTVSATPIIGDQAGDVGPEPKIIIPKINLEVPVVYNVGTVEENAIQDALEDGVVHYAASPVPGQRGNAVIVGHSSNNILNSGRYKFAFVLLNRLEAEDTFFIQKDGIRYTYKVYEKKIVPPSDVSVLGPAARDSSVTLITCDPPGTSINRLIIVAEQISPDPSGNTEAVIDIESVTKELPSNAPTMWSRLTSWL
jgi:sortase A